MKSHLPLIKSVNTPLAANIFSPLGLSAGMSAAEAAIRKNIYGSGTTALMISHEKIEDIMKIVKSLGGSGLLIKGIIDTIKNEAKGQQGGFLSMLLVY